jgi:hypothetical protein
MAQLAGWQLGLGTNGWLRRVAVRRWSVGGIIKHIWGPGKWNWRTSVC